MQIKNMTIPSRIQYICCHLCQKGHLSVGNFILTVVKFVLLPPVIVRRMRDKKVIIFIHLKKLIMDVLIHCLL